MFPTSEIATDGIMACPPHALPQLTMFRLVLLFLGICTITIAFGLGRSSTPDKVQPPNILFIAVDDLNDWTGFLGGHPQALTPNMDSLADRAILFANTSCPAPLCNPSRTAVFTGIEPSQSGVYDNKLAFRKLDGMRDAVTLPQYFSEHGYRSMRGGKMFHHQIPPDEASWDEAFPSMKKHKPHGAQPSKEVMAADPIRNLMQALQVPDGRMDDGMVADWAVGQLGQAHENPFFLAVGIYHPHLPWHAPEKYFDMHPLASIIGPEVLADDLDDIPPMGQEIAKTTANSMSGRNDRFGDLGLMPEMVQAYLASTTFADACVGKVLDALEASPHRDNTIIVLWSDHGWHLGEKQHWAKETLWEEAARAVLMIVDPRSGEPGSVSESPVNLIDIYPTLIELAGLRERSDLAGPSVVPLMNNVDADWPHDSLTTLREGCFSLRTSDYRYIRYSDGSEELYDHRVDPNEWQNLAVLPEHNVALATMGKCLDAKLSEIGQRN
jgi:arylsulfatase A-like enzyme